MNKRQVRKIEFFSTNKQLRRKKNAFEIVFHSEVWFHLSPLLLSLNRPLQVKEMTKSYSFADTFTRKEKSSWHRIIQA